jgi:hypothetical protein
LDFLRVSLAMASKLVDSGFLYAAQDLQRLVAKLFAVIAALGTSADVSLNGPGRDAFVDERARSAAALDAISSPVKAHWLADAPPSDGVAPPPLPRGSGLDRNVHGDLPDDDDGGDDAPEPARTAGRPARAATVVEMVNNPLAGANALRFGGATQEGKLGGGAEEAKDEAAAAAAASAAPASTADATSAEEGDEEDGVDDDVWDEAAVSAARKGLNLEQLAAVFGRANAAALLLHDDLKTERAAGAKKMPQSELTIHA